MLPSKAKSEFIAWIASDLNKQWVPQMMAGTMNMEDCRERPQCACI